MHGSIQRAQRAFYLVWRNYVNDGALPGTRELLNAAGDYWFQCFLAHTSSFANANASIRYFNRISHAVKQADEVPFIPIDAEPVILVEATSVEARTPCTFECDSDCSECPF
jgi:hypothetical protein